MVQVSHFVDVLDRLRQTSGVEGLDDSERRLLRGHRGFVLQHSFGRVVYDPSTWGIPLQQWKAQPMNIELRIVASTVCMAPPRIFPMLQLHRLHSQMMQLKSKLLDSERAALYLFRVADEVTQEDQERLLAEVNITPLIQICANVEEGTNNGHGYFALSCGKYVRSKENKRISHRP